MRAKSWNDVTVNQFVKLHRTSKKEKEQDIEAIDLLTERASILKGVSNEDALNISLDELTAFGTLVKSPLPTRIYETYQLNGIWYEFILKPGELDAERHAGIMEAIKLDPIEGIAQTMYYLSKPFKLGFKRKYYKLDKSLIPETLKDFGNMPISVAYPMAVFFLKVSKACTSYLVGYSTEKLTQIKKQVEEAQIDLLSSMDGLKQ